MLRIAVCDDERAFADKVKSRIEGLIPECVVDVFHSGREFLRSVMDYDIVFMDIELPDGNGLEMLQKHPVDSIIIICTLHGEEVYNGYYVRAFRFLLKPIDDFLFREAVFSAVRELKKQSTLSVYDEGGNLASLPIRKIVYAEAGDKRTGIRTLSAFYYTHFPIHKTYEFLDLDFYFVHRSYIVNMRYIERMDVKNKMVEMRDGSKIAVSRLKWKDFKDAFFSFLKMNMGGGEGDA